MSICHEDRAGDRGQVHAVLVRSTIAHGRLESVDAASACRMPGVLAVWTAADPERPGARPSTARPVPFFWATSRISFAGQPVAVVVATSPAEAGRAADAVRINVEALPTLLEPRDSARLGAPRLFDDAPGNTCASHYSGNYDKTVQAFDKAAHVTRLRVVGRRRISRTCEMNAMVAVYDPASNDCLLHVGSMPGRHEPVNAESLIAEYAGVFEVARQIGRPVEWVVQAAETVSDDGEGHDYDIDWELALDGEGHFLALRETAFVGVGAFMVEALPQNDEPMPPRALGALYRAPLTEIRRTFVFTNTAPSVVASTRGLSETTGFASGEAVEQLIDAAASEMGVDPFDLRGRNLGHVCESVSPEAQGSVAEWLQSAASLSDFDGFGIRKADGARRGRRRGRGVGISLSGAGTAGQHSTMAVHPDGVHVVEVEIDVRTGAFAIVKYTAVGRHGVTTNTDGVRVYTGEASRKEARPAVMNALADALGAASRRSGQIEWPVTPHVLWRALNAPPPMLGLY